MALSDKPAAEHSIDAALVRALLRSQHQDLADLPLAPLASGWDNTLYRLGKDLVVRLPRRSAAAHLLENELRWLPVLAPRLPLPVPTPMRRGSPAHGYPWCWSVCRWLPGTSAIAAAPEDAEAAARALGEFLAALHQAAPADAPFNPYRSISLAQRASFVREHLEHVRSLLEDGVRGALERAWRELEDTPGRPVDPCWIHGDLHPANLLVREGRLSAVIDFGDLCAGDPAADLAVAWMLLPQRAHATFFRAAGMADDEHALRRAKAWAIARGLAILTGSEDEPLMRAMATTALERVSETA